MLYKRISFLSLTVLITGAAIAQSLDKEKLDQYTHVLEANNKLMGRMLVHQDGKDVYARSLGFSNIEKATKPGINTMYRIGSISKTITAVLV